MNNITSGIKYKNTAIPTQIEENMKENMTLHIFSNFITNISGLS